MSDDPEVGARRISAADIDEVFVIVAYNSGSSAVEDKTEAHMVCFVHLDILLKNSSISLLNNS